MSLWLHPPALSGIQTSLAHAVHFPAHACLYILLWMVFLTAFGLLCVAIRDTYRESGVERPSFREVEWEHPDVRGGSAMEKGEIVVDEVD